MTLEKVKLLVFGEGEGNWFRRFGLKLEEDESGVDAVAQVEAAAGRDTWRYLRARVSRSAGCRRHRASFESSLRGDGHKVRGS